MNFNKHLSWILLILLALSTSMLIIKFVPTALEDSIEILQHIAIIVGVIVGLGLLYQRNALMINENQRFIKAVEMLESTSVPVRVGALHALGRIALERGFFEQCKQIITLYVQNECESTLMKEQKKEWQKSHKAHRVLFEDIKVAINILSGFKTQNRINLQGLDFEGINFKKNGVELKNIDFSYSNLKEANFGETADLSSCKFKGAELSGVDLSDSNLHGVNLSNANLSDVDLTGANLAQANLKGANLCNANLYSASLPYVNLNGAILENANLPETNLKNADMTGVQIQNASLKKSNLKNANLTGANLTETYLRKADLSNAQLEGAHIDEAILSETICDKYAFDGYIDQTKYSFTPSEGNCGTVNEIE